MTKFGTGMLEASLEDYAREYRAKLKRTTMSLNSLKNQDSPYAQEHRVLIDLFNKHLDNIEKAKP